MPVTEKNFRNDPRRRAFVEVLSGFFLGPDRAAVEGEVIEMPYGEAMSVIHSNKARLCDGPARPAPPPPPAKVLQARRDAAARGTRGRRCGTRQERSAGRGHTAAAVTLSFHAQQRASGVTTMANISGKPRVGWVNPREAPGMGAKEACLEAGAGNVSAEPPASVDHPNPRPSVDVSDYPTPRDSGTEADGETGGNYEGLTPPYAPESIPAGGKPPGQEEG